MALDGKTFQAIVAIERKLERNEALTPEEQALVAKYGLTGPKLCGYQGCSNKLGPRVDGEHHRIGDVFVCDDCYFSELGDALEDCPILPPRLRRRVASATKLANESTDAINAHLARLK